MFIGLTTDFTFTLPYSLNTVKKIVVTFEQEKKQIVKEFNNFSINNTSNQLIVTLTDKETEKFIKGPVIKVKYTLTTREIQDNSGNIIQPSISYTNDEIQIITDIDENNSNLSPEKPEPDNIFELNILDGGVIDEYITR